MFSVKLFLKLAEKLFYFVILFLLDMEAPRKRARRAKEEAAAGVPRKERLKEKGIDKAEEVCGVRDNDGRGHQENLEEGTELGTPHQQLELVDDLHASLVGETKHDNNCIVNFRHCSPSSS